MSSPPDRPTTIVVGVDGSPSSLQAFRWAVREAELARGEVHAVAAWHAPSTTGWDSVLDDVDWSQPARQALDVAVGSVDTPVTVHRHVVEGHAARVLTDRSADADMVVVGSRGHGHLVGRFTGSVPLHVLSHAHCPVVVVHGDRLPGPGPRSVSGSDAGSLVP